MVKFGSDLVVFNVINYFSRNFDNVLIGRYHGSGELGFYSKAYQLLMMPITNLRDPITSVAMPALSRLQNNPEQYRNYYLKCVSLLAFISMPLVVFMFVFSDQLIDLLLGSQWMDASKIFKILAIAAFIQPVSFTSGMVLISTGRTKLYLTLGFLSAIVICCSFVAGLPWGAKGVATGYTISNYLVSLPVLHYTFKDTPISIRSFFYSVHRPFFASFLMGCMCFITTHFLSDLNMIGVLIIGLIISSVVYVLSFSLFPDGLNDLREYFSYRRLLYEKK
jgi:PST family polysaccharide transporter